MNTANNEPSKMKEEPEGSRENADLGTPSPSNLGGDAGAPMERGAGQVSRPEKPLDDTGGITNRPLDEEERNQRDLPPRREAKPDARQE